MLKFSGLVIWRLGSQNYLRKYSASGVTILKNTTESSGNVSDKNIEESPLLVKEGLVAAAFASLNDPVNENRKPSLKSFKQSRGQQIDNQILKAEDLNSLLLVAENPIVSRRHALKMVSILSEWSSSNKVNLIDFEKDPRFLKLCRILARTPATQAMSSLTMAEDLSTVLGITGDDEAARLIANLSLPQMIKVMKALQQKGRRSTPLLRALSYNITKQSEPLDLKKSADLLYSMAALNFPDPTLSDRICSDIVDCLAASNGGRPAVVNSIVVSLGLLRLRHEAALAALARWLRAALRERPHLARAGDLASAVVTLAALGYESPHAAAVVEAALLLKKEEMVKASSWLDLVYALLILDRAERHHLVSTLKPDFIETLLSAGEIPIPSRLKLMSIDAYVGLKYPSSETRLAEDISLGVPVQHGKEKALYVQSILDTFKSLVSADAFLRRACDSGMGFLYDAEFAVDSKCHPVPLSQADTRNEPRGSSVDIVLDRITVSHRVVPCRTVSHRVVPCRSGPQRAARGAAGAGLPRHDAGRGAAAAGRPPPALPPARSAGFQSATGPLHGVQSERQTGDEGAVHRETIKTNHRRVQRPGTLILGIIE